MSHYLLGRAHLFIAVAGLALAVGVAYALIRFGEWLNSKTHSHMVEKITVHKNLADPFGSKPERPAHCDQATKFRDALLRSPKMWLFRAFGVLVVVVRDYREEVRRPLKFEPQRKSIPGNAKTSSLNPSSKRNTTRSPMRR